MPTTRDDLDIGQIWSDKHPWRPDRKVVVVALDETHATVEPVEQYRYASRISVTPTRIRYDGFRRFRLVGKLDDVSWSLTHRLQRLDAAAANPGQSDPGNEEEQ